MITISVIFRAVFYDANGQKLWVSPEKESYEEAEQYIVEPDQTDSKHVIGYFTWTTAQVEKLYVKSQENEEEE